MRFFRCPNPVQPDGQTLGLGDSLQQKDFEGVCPMS